eukprot:9023088-Heterocapsa_arctica.AAC.1
MMRPRACAPHRAVPPPALPPPESWPSRCFLGPGAVEPSRSAGSARSGSSAPPAARSTAPPPTTGNFPVAACTSWGLRRFLGAPALLRVRLERSAS